MTAKTIHAALVAAQRGFAPALKTSTNPHLRHKYADLSACVEAVIDALNANGIYLMQRTEATEDSVTVETVFVHESGETIEAGRLTLPVLPSGKRDAEGNTAGKRNAQGFGSALTYARRYSLMAACGIAPEDDDGNGAVGTNGKTKAATITPEQVQQGAALPAYADADFAKNLPAWTKAMHSGKKTAQDVIATISTKYTLSDEQRRRIYDAGRPEALDVDPKTGEILPTEQDDFISQYNKTEADQ